MSFCMKAKSNFNSILKGSLQSSGMFTLTEAIFALFLAYWSLEK